MTTIATGPPGVEVPARWNDVITMNVISARPRIKIDKITGRFSLAEADDNREPRTGRRGERTLPSDSRGKTEVWEGSVQGRSLNAVEQRAAELRNAFRDRSNEHTMLLMGEIEWVFNARTMQFDADSSHAEYDGERVLPWQIPFTLGLRLSDARYYTLESPVVSEDNADGDDVDLTNLGGTDTDPNFSVTTGSDDTVELKNNSLGAVLKFEHLPAGTLVVDFLHRTALVGAVDVVPRIDEVASNWWDSGLPGVAPGANNIEVVGGIWSCSFLHASE